MKKIIVFVICFMLIILFPMSFTSALYLNDIKDVTITLPKNGHLLTYNSSISKWVNANPCWNYERVNFSFGSVYNYFKNITINKDLVASTQTNIPILVHDNTGDLLNKVKTNCSDLDFWDKDNTTQLSHEVEFYNPTSGELFAWVKIPSLSDTTNTYINMRYGNLSQKGDAGNNPSDVWSNDYVFVCHMNKSDGSFWNSVDGLESVSDTGLTKITGRNNMIGVSQYYDADGDKIDFGDVYDIGVNDVTLESYYQTTAENTRMILMTKYESGTDYGYFYGCDETDDYGLSFYYKEGNNWIIGMKKESDDYHVEENLSYYTVLTANRGVQFKLFWKGENSPIDDDFNFENNIQNSGSLLIGSRLWSGIYTSCRGYIDEIRLSFIVRSADWVNISYYSITEKTGFMSIGTEIIDMDFNIIRPVVLLNESYERVGINDLHPDYGLELPNWNNISGKIRANAFETYSDARFKNYINLLPENKVLSLCRIIDWYYYNPIENTQLIDGTIIIGNIDYSKILIGTNAQILYEKIENSFNTFLASQLVYKPNNKNTDYWAVDYDKIFMIYAKAWQINDIRITTLENEIIKIKELMGI